MQKILNLITKNPLYIFGTLLLFTLLFYGSSLRFGFSQDDFFHFVLARTNSFSDFVNFFIPQGEKWLFFRPLSTQLTYWSFASLFGYANSAIPMHIFMLLLHAFNGYLVFVLIRKLQFNQVISLFVSLCYVIAGVHFLSLFYIGALQELLAVMGSLLSIIYSLKKSNKLSAGWLIFALLSKEIALRTLPILFILHFYQNSSVKQTLRNLVFPILVGTIYLLFRLVLGTTGASEYSFSLSPATILATIMWYGLFTLGLPEHILSFGQALGRIDFGSYLQEQQLLGSLNLLSSFAIFVFLARSIIVNLSFGRYKQTISFLVLWLVALSPILLLPTHRYAHYLDLSLVFVLTLAINSLSSLRYKTLFFLVFCLASATSIMIDQNTHWTTERAKIVSKITPILRESGACQGHRVAFVGEPFVLQQVSYALASENGPMIICNNPSLKVYYLSTAQDKAPSSTVIELPESIL